ncbi:hypothetical protein [Acidithiobacillus sp.]|uniref:hypothetical protein n=1 Tax=Acidithiobacillus sp. TaxID=1872118 RepID=UPI003D0244FF
MTQQNEFKELPHAGATIKGNDEKYYNVSMHAPRKDDPLREAGGLRGSLSIQDPQTKAREKHAVDLKPREGANGEKYLSGVIDRGEDQKPILVRVVGVDGRDGRFGVVRLSEMDKGPDGKTTFQAIEGHGGIVRMNQPLADLAKSKEPYELEVMHKQIGVEKEAMEPKQKPDQERAEPTQEQAAEHQQGHDQEEDQAVGMGR